MVDSDGVDTVTRQRWSGTGQVRMHHSDQGAAGNPVDVRVAKLSWEAARYTCVVGSRQSHTPTIDE